MGLSTGARSVPPCRSALMVDELQPHATRGCDIAACQGFLCLWSPCLATSALSAWCTAGRQAWAMHQGRVGHWGRVLLSPRYPLGRGPCASPSTALLAMRHSSCQPPPLYTDQLMHVAASHDTVLWMQVHAACGWMAGGSPQAPPVAVGMQAELQVRPQECPARLLFTPPQLLCAAEPSRQHSGPFRELARIISHHGVTAGQ